jgi:hypothetical protein
VLTEDTTNYEAEALVEHEIVLAGPPQLGGKRMSRRAAEAAT